MKKLLVMLLASAFALTAFAQAPKSDGAPKAQTSAEKKEERKAARAKARADRKAAKAKARADRKEARAEKKAESK
jgi:Ni/Co efflux regulator RcnB